MKDNKKLTNAINRAAVKYQNAAPFLKTKKARRELADKLFSKIYNIAAKSQENCNFCGGMVVFERASTRNGFKDIAKFYTTNDFCAFAATQRWINRTWELWRYQCAFSRLVRKVFDWKAGAGE